MEHLTQLIEQNSFGELKRSLMTLPPADIAEFIGELDDANALVVFRLLPKDICSDVFAYMSPGHQQHIILSISDSEANQLLNGLFVDDTVDLLEEVPAGLVKKILRNLNEEFRSEVNQFLKYEPNTAGGIMTSEFVDFHINSTVKSAIEKIRRTALDKETVYTCFVIDKARKLKGIISLRKLLLAEDHILVQDIMQKHIISVRTSDDREIVADQIHKYDYLSIPVVDSEDRLVGIVTVDDAMDVIEEEYEEDFELMAGVTPSEKEYLDTSVWEHARKRIIWLMLLMLSATLTSAIIGKFEHLLESVILLTSFIPMLTGTGGNAGSQAATLVIRGLAVNNIKAEDFLQVLWKELRVSLLCGTALASVNFLRMVFLGKIDTVISLVVCASVAVTVVASKLIGGLLPIVASKVRVDPAIMASPLISTIIDSLSLFIYFIIATALLGL